MVSPVDRESSLETEVSARLNLLLEAASGEDQQFHYGFVLHQRRNLDGMVFGMITSGGESLAVNGAMLRSIAGSLCWAFGAVPFTLEPAGSTDPESEVRRLTVRVPSGILEDPELRALCPVHGPIDATAMAEPMVILLDTRPQGWPC
jgi:hypothetical protein